MKVRTLDVNEKVFTPVTLELTFHTQAEVDAFHCLMNWTPAVAPVADILSVAGIRRALPTSPGILKVFRDYVIKAEECVEACG